MLGMVSKREEVPTHPWQFLDLLLKETNDICAFSAGNTWIRVQQSHVSWIPVSQDTLGLHQVDFQAWGWLGGSLINKNTRFLGKFLSIIKSEFLFLFRDSFELITINLVGCISILIILMSQKTLGGRVCHVEWVIQFVDRLQSWFWSRSSCNSLYWYEDWIVMEIEVIRCEETTFYHQKWSKHFQYTNRSACKAISTDILATSGLASFTTLWGAIGFSDARTAKLAVCWRYLQTKI